MSRAAVSMRRRLTVSPGARASCRAASRRSRVRASASSAYARSGPARRDGSIQRAATGVRTLVQSLGPASEQAKPSEEDHAGDGVGSLHQAGTGEVVVDEPLGAEPREQTLRHPLLEVQVHGVVGEHPGILEDDRADGRLPPPVGELLTGLPGRAQGVKGRGPARVGIGLSVEGRKRPDRSAIFGATFL